jgi:OFA family oxalate/formate antiporter-like MFS transporter
VLPVSLVFLSGAVFSLLETERAPNGFLSFALLVGLGYGGALVLYAAQAAQVWGLARVGSIYPLVMLFHGAAALIGPGLAGYILDRTDSFNPALVLGGSTALVGAALVLVLGLTDHRRAKRMTDVSEEVLV